MSETGSVDYEAVLADLRAKREKIDAAIHGIEVMLGIQAVSASVPKQTAEAWQSAALGPGAFLGMTIVDAAKKYLDHKRQNQRTEEILKALTDGGLVLTGESPLNVVGSVLNRNYNNGGEIVKVSRGVWGLAAWHPRLRKKAGEAKNGSADVSQDEGQAQAEPAAPESDL